MPPSKKRARTRRKVRAGRKTKKTKTRKVTRRRAKKIIVHTSGEVLKGLSHGDKVMYQGKEHIFITYRDSGFNCLIQKPPAKGKIRRFRKHFLVVGSQVKRHLQEPPKLDDKQKKGLQKFIDSFLNFEKFNDFRDFQKSSGVDKLGRLDTVQIDFIEYHICLLVKNQHKSLTKIIKKA